MNEINDLFFSNENKIYKWKKLKILLDSKKSLESSLRLLKEKTLDQFMQNYIEIYKYKIASYLFSKEVNKIFFDKAYIPEIYKNIEISDDYKELCYDSCLKDFLFYFRDNNSELIKIIELLPEEETKEFSFFLCHLFYDNFINEKCGEDELIFMIYLLLEKEVNGLSSPREDKFLNNSFMDYFFRIFFHREEVKNYFYLVLISGIENINQTCFEYYSLDIINDSKTHYKEFIDYKHDHSFFNMEKQYFYVNQTFHCQKMEVPELHSDNFIVIEKNLNDEITNNNQLLTNMRKINYENITINSILLNEFFNEINHNHVQKLFLNEKDELMREFYLRQLKLNQKGSFSINCRDYYENMVKIKLVSRNAVDNYNKGYHLIIKFINNFLKNFEKNIIIPFSIKIICKFIYVLFKKKFPNLSEFQLYLFVGKFLFDKLIITIFENIDVILIECKKQIKSLELKKTLVDIYYIFKKLTKGEIFINKEFEKYKIFNQFILNNFFRIKNIIQTFINIKIPNNIASFIDYYHMEETRQSEEKINKSIEQNHMDISQKCICFKVTHLFLLYNIVNNNKTKFIKEGTKFEKIFNELSQYIPQIELNNNKRRVSNRNKIFY